MFQVLRWEEGHMAGKWVRRWAKRQRCCEGYRIQKKLAGKSQRIATAIKTLQGSSLRCIMHLRPF
jgi:hypothetical protein